MRHAWLIIAHGNFEILEKQLRFLDSENADFFIHIDAKVNNFDFDRFRSIPKKSSVTFVDRIRISWGHHSQIQCEYVLLKAAIGGHYDYYHLLSGVDVPVKSREYIENYFRPDGTNYLHFHLEELIREYTDRVRFYYPLQRLNIQNRVIRLILRRLCVLGQRLVSVNRLKSFPDGTVLQKGANWFSITHEFAEYVLSRRDFVAEHFRSTFCCDEMFMHTLLMNSPFRNTIPSEYYGLDHRNCLRYIDWERGKPYTFTDADFDELTHTDAPYLFARKFSYRSNPQLVDRLFDYFSDKQSEGKERICGTPI